MSAIVDFLSEEGVVSGELIAHLEGLIEGIPHQPSRIHDLGLFSSVSLLNTTTVKFDQTEWGLELIQSSARGSDAPKQAKLGRSTVHFETVRIAKEVELLADEILSLRALGSTAPEQVDTYFANKSRPTIASMRATREWNMLGALKGEVRDADGTVLVDLYTKMGRAKPEVVYFDLDAASPKTGAILETCNNIVRATSDALGGISYSHVHAMAGRGVMDKLRKTKETRETFANQMAELRRGTAFKTFEYGDIVFEEYRGVVGGQKFIEDDEVRFFPVGGLDLFTSFYAPADRIGYEGLGAVEYALPYIDPKGRSRSVEFQSNLVSIMKRPDALIEGRAGAAPAV